MFSEHPDICSQKKGARKDEKSSDVIRVLETNNRNDSLVQFIDNKPAVDGIHPRAQSTQQQISNISKECSAQNWEAQFIANKFTVNGNEFGNKTAVKDSHLLAQSVQQQINNIPQECGDQNYWEAPTNNIQSNYEQTTGTSADSCNFPKDHRPEFKETETVHLRRQSSCSSWGVSFVDNLDGSVYNFENELGNELDVFSLGGNDNELEAETLKSSLDTSKSWASMGVAALNFLDVHSAEFKRLDTEAENIYNSSINVDENSNKTRRIYNLRLVFYELFSGGQIPPPTLHALASSDGAFTSLSTTTLVKRTDEPPMEAKRHQGSTKSETEVGLCQLSFEYLRLIGVPNPISGVIYNMMDCVYGDLSSRECYSALDEVSKFLRGLNMDNIPSFVTQLNEIKITRHQEFEDIMSGSRGYTECSAFYCCSRWHSCDRKV
ncbi:hypothetical protein ACHAWO_011564 [Cyclotella atomus]|uniref:Uncharacterized protein n=1 Tax=Cyclotella atomus TaxID=382360 RepID=A0ABD3N0K0_9STRA